MYGEVYDWTKPLYALANEFLNSKFNFIQDNSDLKNKIKQFKPALSEKDIDFIACHLLESQQTELKYMLD